MDGVTINSTEHAQSAVSGGEPSQIQIQVQDTGERLAVQVQKEQVTGANLYNTVAALTGVCAIDLILRSDGRVLTVDETILVKELQNEPVQVKVIRGPWSKRPAGPVAASYSSSSQALPARARQQHDFGGATVQFVQIGLGTNTTFIQNLAGPWADWSDPIDWLSSSMSETHADLVRGVAVEPVKELLDAFRPMAQSLPGVCLVNVAIGDQNKTGAHMVGVSRKACIQLAQQLTPIMRDDFLWHLQCLINMSTVQQRHPESASYLHWLYRKYGIAVPVVRQHVDVWSYERLAAELNFSGCQVLMIDAEGWDAQILRSVIDYCQRKPNAWPDVIQFETMGHCDKLQGPGTERRTVRQLESNGYILLGYSRKGSYLVRRGALERRPCVKKWMLTWHCDCCKRCERFPYIATHHGVFCRQCNVR